MSQDLLLPLLDRSLTINSPSGSREKIGIIGTGNYAMALSKRLLVTGYDVVLASRRPSLRQSTFTLSNDCLCGVELTSIPDCLSRCQIVFVAIHMEDFKVTLHRYSDKAKDKIIIDVSNRENRYAAHSNAELLASILPQAQIVKAFNSVSAHTMEGVSTQEMTHRVFLASDCPRAKVKVGELAKTMGFRVVDLGGLKSARYMEDFVLKLFSGWKGPICLTFGIFSLWSLYIVYFYFVEKTAYHWEQIFLKVFNKPLCMTAITVLALTYLPGHVATIVQLYHGTKHRKFPKGLDSWLRCRKQLGLISLFLVTLHVIASTLMLSPTYYSSWFHKTTVTLPANTTLTSDLVLPLSTSWMVWKGEAACLLGVVAFLLMSVVGITSIPSVGQSLSWAEWRCVHSKLSYAVIALSVGHVSIMGAPGWVKIGPVRTLRSITFLSLLLPSVVLLLKLLFSCPPLSPYIRKIRRGWERDRSAGTTETVEMGDSSAVMLDTICGCGQEQGVEGTTCNVMRSGYCQCSAV